MNLLWQHWVMFLIVGAIFYAIGARKPTLIPYLGTG